MLILLIILWLILEIKYVLFWLYLWQLKEYHIARFIDHFRTDKGRKIFLNSMQIAKAAVFVLLLTLKPLFNLLLLILFLVYLFQFVVLLKGIALRTVKTPRKTFKIMFLGIISFAILALFLLQIYKLEDLFQPALLLGFDLLTPLIISIIVLLFQPIFVLIRNVSLYRAKKKLKKIKFISEIKVIAITGSYGKTSVKEFLSTILSQKYNVLSTAEHQNSEIGIAKCILKNLKPSHQIFVAEVGAYNKGKVKEVCNMLKPQIGIVTGVNEQHMALFGSLENLLSAEGGGELAQSLPKDGVLVVNGDNKYCLDLYKKAPRELSKKIYSLSSKVINSDIWADEISVHKDSVSFVAINKFGEAAHFGVNVLGKQSVQNLLGTILISKELGMSLEEISLACTNIIPKQAGMTLRNGKYGINIIDSSYSANSDGVLADLDYLSTFSGKKAIVMPCLIELGKESKAIHEKIGRKIGEVCDLAIITSQDKFKDIKRGALDSGMKEKNILFCENSHDIYSMVTLFCKSGDAVLLEGRVPKELIGLLSA